MNMVTYNICLYGEIWNYREILSLTVSLTVHDPCFLQEIGILQNPM